VTSGVASAAFRPTAAPSSLLRLDGKAGFASACAAVLALGAFDGGYYPRTWGWATLGALAVALGLLITTRPSFSRPERLGLGALAGLVVWTAVSAARTGAATRGVPSVERDLLYLAVLSAALLLVRRSSAGAVLGGLLAGVTALSSFGLERYLFDPAGWDTYEGRLLYQPLGYANGEGALAAMGAAVALGLSAHARSRAGRAVAASALVPLLSALAFTSSRAAQGAFVVGLGVMLLLDRGGRMLTTLLLGAPLPLLAVWLHSRTGLGSGSAQAHILIRQGHLLAGVIGLLALAQFALAYAASARPASMRAARAVATVCLAAPLLAVAFSARALGDRPAFWRAAWSDIAAHPLLGSGAGSYEVAWLRYRTIPVGTRSAHNLYLETLSELGPIGLALLVVALAVPVVLAVRAGRSRSAATTAAAGAYVIFLAHAALDWDWQLPVLVVCALLCAAVVLVNTAPSDAPPATSRARAGWLAASVAVGLAAAVGLVANARLAAGVHAAAHGDLAHAAALARSAARWEPWSAEPHVFRGEVELARGDRAVARREFGVALRLDPADWQTWLELARIAPPAERRAALSRAGQLNPLGR
jgi:O-antigen ligase